MEMTSDLENFIDTLLPTNTHKRSRTSDDSNELNNPKKSAFCKDSKDLEESESPEIHKIPDADTPTASPTASPTKTPTASPTASPTKTPTKTPTATYIIKNGIPHAFPEYDIYTKHLDEMYFELKLTDICQKLSGFIIIFNKNKMKPTPQTDRIITNIHQDLINTSTKIINQFKNRFNQIIVIFNQILAYYNDIRNNKIKITTFILFDLNNLNRQLLSLYGR